MSKGCGVALVLVEYCFVKSWRMEERNESWCLLGLIMLMVINKVESFECSWCEYINTFSFPSSFPRITREWDCAGSSSSCYQQSIHFLLRGGWAGDEKLTSRTDGFPSSFCGSLILINLNIPSIAMSYCAVVLHILHSTTNQKYIMCMRTHNKSLCTFIPT